MGFAPADESSGGLGVRMTFDRTREIMDECYEKTVGQVPAISTLNRKPTYRYGGGGGGPLRVGGWLPGPLPLPASLVVGLPAGLASLVVVGSFYSGSVVGVERAA
jgi:hypothetical protein